MSLTELFCEIDDFCQYFEPQRERVRRVLKQKLEAEQLRTTS